MNNAVLIFIGVAYIGVIGVMGALLTVVQVDITPLEVITAPGDTNVFQQILAPFRFAIEIAGGFFQLMTYQIDGIHPIISTMILTPISFLFGYIVFRMVRGGG